MDWLVISVMLNVVIMNDIMYWMVYYYSLIIIIEIMEYVVVIFIKMKCRIW